MSVKKGGSAEIQLLNPEGPRFKSWPNPRVGSRPVVHAERWVGNRFSLADGTSARRLEAIPLPEHESAVTTFGRNLRQPATLGMEAFPKVLQVIRDLFLRPSDGRGDLLRRKGTFLQEGEDLMPHGFRFHRIWTRQDRSARWLCPRDNFSSTRSRYSGNPSRLTGRRRIMLSFISL